MTTTTRRPSDGRAVETLVGDLAGARGAAFEGLAPSRADAAGDAKIAAESQRAYEAIWRRIGSWYAGVNAAAMALVAGDAEEGEGARRRGSEAATRRSLRTIGRRRRAPRRC